MRIIISFFSFLYCCTLLAYTPKDYQATYFCPTAHSAYKNALTKLKELKGQLESLECKEISSQIDNLSALHKDREEVIDIVSKNEDGVLSGESAQKLQEYTATATQTAATIVEMARSAPELGIWGSIMGTNSCSLDETSRFEVIRRASSVVYETTQLAAKVAGPYGIPISIGGTALSGVLQGVSLFMQSNTKIDFSDENKRLFYAESLCLYHQFDLELDQIMNPQTQEESFSILKRHLEGIVNQINEDCKKDTVGCGNKVDTLIEAFKDFDPTEDDEKSFVKTHKELIDELDEYSTSISKNEAWGSLIARTLEKRESSTESSQLIEKIIDSCNKDAAKCGDRAEKLIDSFFNFEPQPGEERNFALAHKSLIDELDAYSKSILNTEKWGTLVSTTLLNYNWASTEVDRFSSIINYPTKGMEKGEVQVLRIRITNFFKDTANEELIKWFVHTEIPARVSALKKAVRSIPLFKHGSRVDEQRVQRLHSSEKIFQYIFENYRDLKKGSSFSSAILSAYNEWKALEERFASYKEYCQFFNDSLLITTKTEDYCSGVRQRNIERTKELMARTAFSLAFIIQDRQFPKRAARITFDLSLNKYLAEAAGLPVRKKTAVALGNYYFENSDEVSLQSEKEYFIVADMGDVAADMPLASPVVVSEERSFWDPCQSGSLNWQEKMNCRIRDENARLSNRNFVQPGSD